MNRQPARQGEIQLVELAWHSNRPMDEAERVVHTGAEPEIIDTPSASGKGQRIARCPKCKVAIWSNYSQSGALSRFVRVGTLDEPDRLPPDIHIYTSSKQPWVTLPSGAKAVPAFYNPADVWSPQSLQSPLLDLADVNAECTTWKVPD